MPGRMFTHAARRASTKAWPAFSASTTEGKVVYTNTARSIPAILPRPVTEYPVIMSQRRDRIAFVTSAAPQADTARDALVQRYGETEPAEADVIVALGGDGLMLQTL